MKTGAALGPCAIRRHAQRRPRLYQQGAGWKTAAMAPQECAATKANGRAFIQSRK